MNDLQETTSITSKSVSPGKKKEEGEVTKKAEQMLLI